jgi:ligand-binding sensor domain-containing protein/two-component sensor histidine kinase
MNNRDHKYFAEQDICKWGSKSGKQNHNPTKAPKAIFMGHVKPNTEPKTFCMLARIFLNDPDLSIHKAYLLLLLVFTSLAAPAQNPYIQNFTTADGLPSNHVYKVYQDSRNFIWFATDAGVARYDGSGFMYLRKRDGLNSNQIINIKEDSQGRLWFFNLNATLNFYQNEVLHHPGNAPFLDSLASQFFLIHFFEDENRTLYFYMGSRDEVNVLDSQNRVTKHRITSRSIASARPEDIQSSHGRIYYITKDQFGSLNLYTSFGRLRSNHHLKEFERFPPGFEIFNAIPASDSVVYFVSDYYSPEKFRVLRFLKNQPDDTLCFPSHFFPIHFTSFLEEPEGYLWAATYYHGLLYLKDKEIINQIDIPASQALTHDHEGNVWTSSLKSGAYKISPGFRSQKFYGRKHFMNSGVTGLAKHREKGIWVTNGKNIFLFKDGALYQSSFHVDGVGFSQMAHLENNNLLLGELNNFLYTLTDMRTDENKQQIVFEKSVVSNEHIKKIVFNRTGKLVNSFYSAYLFLMDAGDTENLEITDFPHGRIFTTFYNAYDELCINSSRNFRYINGKFEPYEELSVFNNKIIRGHLVMNDSAELFNIEGDDLYLLTASRAINLTSAFQQPIDQQIKYMEYDHPRLFIATSTHVYICENPLNTIDETPVFLNPIDLVFNNINAILSGDNTLFIATDDGLALIPYESFADIKPIIPIPYFNSIFINDVEYKGNENGTVVRGKNRIQFSFGSINYSGSPVIYAYMVEGLDTEWKTGKEKNVVYQNLPKGDYKLKLRVRKPTTNWSEAIEYDIAVQATLFQRPLFYMFAFLIIAGLALLFVLWKKNTMLRRRETEHQLVMLEQKSLQAMMNPHFIFNTLGSIQNYLLQNKADDAGLYLSQFARLIRQNLSAINSGLTSLEEEIDRLRNYLDLEKLRMENRFDYRITVGVGIEEDEIKIPSMILQPIVENAIWHGISEIEEKGMIVVIFNSHTENSLRVKISDNGVGFRKTTAFAAGKSKHVHLGMELTRKRLEILGSKMHVNTSVEISEATPGHPNPGTLVTLIMPFSYGDDLV